MRPVRTLLAVALAAASSVPAQAQQKRALEHSDYDIWNRIQNDVMSRNGRWLAYQLTPGDGDGVLVVQALQGDRTARIPRGVSPSLTADGRWLVARVAPMDSVVERLKREKKKPADQPKDSLVILDLSSPDPAGAFRAADVKSFEVPAEGSDWVAYLLENPREEGRREGGPSGGEPREETDTAGKALRTPEGSTLVVRDLASGSERRFDHVVDYAFSDDGSVLYYTASGDDADADADGVFRVRPSGDAETVATGEGRYLQLAVADDGAHVAFVSDRDDRQGDAPAFSLYVGGRSGEAAAVVAPGAEGIPAGWAASQNGAVSFSDGGGRVFFGTAARPEAEPEDDTPADEKVSVDVWNWKDPYLQPMQKLQAEQEKKRTYEAVYDVGSGRTVQLATEEVPTVTVAQKGDGSVALGVSDLPYRQLISWDGRYVDVYLVDPSDGSRRKVAEKVKSYPRLSPAGGYVYWWDGEARAWMAVDTRSGETRNLTGSIGQAFYDELDDHPDLPPAYGSAGWTEGDAAFLAYDAYDIWAVDPTGGQAPRNVTEGVGRRSGIRFRYADAEGGPAFGFGRSRVSEAVPADEDVILSAFDTDTRASGFYRDRFDGNREPRRLVMGDFRYRGLTKAEDADVYLFTRESFREFPDMWVTDAGFGSPRRVTDANPQQSRYLWGSEELVHWVSDDGTPLDGILVKPEGFDPSRQYPMMVYFYERMSDQLHAYQAPAAGSSSINRSFYASRGYLVFVPDIPYEIGHPGESAVDAVVPGVLALVEKGFVDRERIGVQGHSWGGYQIAYMITKTNLFRAAEAGAPVANMTSAYGGIRWGSGMSRAFQYERTQSRIGGSLWEKPLLYIENSPLFSADKIETPLLMMHNDEDTAVPWYQGIEFFSALRRLHKPVWMMVYNGEPHGLRKEANRKDWAIRMQQFFDHYLKDAPPSVWLAEGVPAVLKGKTLGLDLERGRTISQGGRGSSR
ncbi:MAG: prolyl oligopeptidase family serine peptidase [Gemmatimonadota bacterium]|jgi:dipeptidyl aminopeptidase/acylaminoacyl peptidase